MRIKLLKGLKNKLRMVLRKVRAKEIYWKTLRLLEFLKFNTLRQGFYITQWIGGRTQDLGIGWSIFSGGFYSLISSFVIFLATEFIGKIAVSLIPNAYSILSNLKIKLFDLLSLKITYDNGSVSGLLGSVSSVAGMLLGLYFTAVSIGVGQLPIPNIRNLVIRERFGTKYIRYLTILTLFSFLLWFKSALIGEVTTLSLTTLVIFSLYLIAGFYPLGMRSFSLAEPAMLSEPLFSEIFLIFERLKKRGLFSNYGPIEDYYRRVVKTKISIIHQVMKLAIEKGDRGIDDTKYITNRLVAVLIDYRTFKQNITTESKWFDVVLKHANWLYPDVTKEQLLHNLGVISQPQTAPDKEWLENDVIAVIDECLHSYEHNKSISGLISLVAVLRPYLNELVLKWDLKQATAHYNLLETAIKPVFDQTEINIESRLQLLEILGLCRIDILIHALKCITDFNVDVTITDLAFHVFGKNKIPKNGVPDSVRLVIDQLSKMLRFEFAVEDKLVSPEWYIKQLIAREYTTEIKRVFSSLVDFVEKNPALVKTVEEALMVALRKQRELELTTRLEGIRASFYKKVEELRLFNRISDIEIVPMADDFERNRLEELRIVQLDSLADVLVPLYRTTRDDSIPDFFGICFRQLVQELFNRLKSGNVSGFKEIFHKVFIGAFLAKDRLALELDGNADQMAKVRIAFEPIVDMLHLSGYAVAFSDLHDNSEFSKLVFTLWENLSNVMSNMETPQKVLEFIIKVLGLQKADFRMMATSFLRFDWKQRFEEQLRQKEFIRQDRINYRSRDSRDALIVPDKPLLKAICDGGHEPYEDPTEWFIVAFLVHEKIDPKNIDLSSIGFWREYLRANENSDEN